MSIPTKLRSEGEGICLLLLVILLSGAALGAQFQLIGFWTAILFAGASVVIVFVTGLVITIVVDSRKRKLERMAVVRQMNAASAENTRRAAEREREAIRKGWRPPEYPQPKNPNKCSNCGGTNIRYRGSFRDHTEWTCSDCGRYIKVST